MKPLAPGSFAAGPSHLASCEHVSADVRSAGRPLPDSVQLADFTTFHVGGPTDRLVVARTEAELIGAVLEADADGTPLLIVSGGSNMLVADEGFPGTAVVVATQGITADVSACAGAYLTVAAGEAWDNLVAEAVAHGWSGLEALSGVPGLVGAAPIQNIGAYGADVASHIARVRTFDRTTGQIRTLMPGDCRFGYRTSLFKQEPDRYVVLSVDLQLKIGEMSAPIEYDELARRLGVAAGARAPIADVRRTVLDLRRGKGMVLDEADHDTWSAGSFFTNPVVSAETAAALPAGAPRFPQSDGSVKTSAAWLIEHAGFPKGYPLAPGRKTAPASLSPKHVLALTNRGGATAEDILSLARLVRDGVHATYGITLEPEPVIVNTAI